jgi:hypothetical protein
VLPPPTSTTSDVGPLSSIASRTAR